MKIQIRGYLMHVICFLFILLLTGDVFAQDKPPAHPPITDQINSSLVSRGSDKPPTAPPQEVKKGVLVIPTMDKPPTSPQQADNYQNTQELENAADDYPPPPPVVEASKQVVGGPVNDKLPDPPTTMPDKKPKGIKKESTNISKVAKIKEEGIHIESAKKQQEGSLQDVMPMKSISVSPESSKGMKKETQKILLPERKLGKGQVKAVGKSLPEHSLRMKQKTDGPTRSIKNTKNPDVINDKEQKGN